MTGKQDTSTRLEEQISWYDRKSTHCQRSYKRLKIAQISAASLIPFVAGLRIEGHIFGTAVQSLLAGTLGIVVVLLEALQHTNKYHELWITYRSTCEALKHEKYLYLARAGPYRTTDDHVQLLAERVEALVSREHAQWLGELTPVRHDTGPNKGTP